jgi:predicted metalloprotease with PDZ domain
MKRNFLALALALAIASPLAAQTSAPAPAATPATNAAQLEAKRAEMRQLEAEMAKLGTRMGELAREMGDGQRRVILSRVGEPRIGLGVVLGEAVDGGARIAAVTPGGPADKAGLKAGDIIRSTHGKTVTEPDELVAALRGIQKGQAVNVGYLRDGRSAAAAVVADELPGRGTVQWNDLQQMEGRLDGLRGRLGRLDMDRDIQIITEHSGPEGVRIISNDGEGRRMSRAFRFRGLSLSSIDADLGRYFGTEKGALLIASSESLPGLKSGDVIVAVDGKEVNGPRDVMGVLGRKEAGEKIALRVLRNRSTQNVEITIPEGRVLDFLPPAPPAPPAPPPPPSAPRGAAPPAPPAPPAAPPPPPSGGASLNA